MIKSENISVINSLIQKISLLVFLSQMYLLRVFRKAYKNIVK